MASNSKSGLNKEQREKILRDCGFFQARDGKGSHENWEHPELKALAKTRSIVPPANLLSNEAQKPWECTLPDNPAGGTWKTIAKYAEWCRETVEKIKNEADVEQRRRAVCSQFRATANSYCQWKKDVNSWLKAGLNVKEAPKPPVTYAELKKLEMQKKRLSAPSS